MQYKQMQNGLKLSKIGFGGAALSGELGGYGFGEIGEKNAEELVEYAIDRGVNVFDTAPIYGFYTSEIRLGKFLKNKRDKVTIASKAGVTWHNTKRVNLSNDPKVIESMLHSSLKHLQTDYIDIYFIHWPDPRVDIRHALEVLAKAKEQNKIGSIGLCNTNNEDLEKAHEVCQIEFLQAESNLFNHHHDSLTKSTSSFNTMGWGTFDKGILSGSVSEDRIFEKEDARSWAPWWKQSHWREKVKKAKKIEKNCNMPIKDIALHFSLLNNDISLCGCKSISQYEEIFNIMNNTVSSEILQKALDVAR